MQSFPCPRNLPSRVLRRHLQTLPTQALRRYAAIVPSDTHDDGRTRLSRIWLPTGGLTPTAGTSEDTPSRLIRAGFLRQAHSGFFHLLPLGLRVQEKLERLIDKHMINLGASKVSLSSISTPDLWKRSCRYKDDHPELFQLEDRKGAKLLLSPTHEEEITALVGGMVNSYKQLPLLLYQTSRKYRDEPRPRQGLLRSREFLMKDLYTFDATPEKALVTYRKVREAYDNFFNELRIRFLVARAASGDIGGSLSHEYHVSTISGEDTFIKCGSCTYAVNEEWATENTAIKGVIRTDEDWGPHQSWFGVSQDRNCLVEAILPRNIGSGEHSNSKQRTSQINPQLIRSIYPDLDLSIEAPLRTFLEYWKEKRSSTPLMDLEILSQPQLIRIYDYRISQNSIDLQDSQVSKITVDAGLSEVVGSRVYTDPRSLNLARVRDGDQCPDCGEKDLRVLQTLELGHTFHLGQRYSKPMDAKFAAGPKLPTESEPFASQRQDQGIAAEHGQEWFYMGCHGIGISRMVAAVADSLADEKGLMWPRAMAPYEAVILATGEQKADAEEIWDLLVQQQGGTDPVEAVLDDRDKSLGWKLKDADLIGFPVVIVLGSTFRKEGLCEVSIRRLGIREKILIENLREYVGRKLAEI